MRTFLYQGVPEPYYDSASPTIEARLARATLGGLSGVALDINTAGIVGVALPVNPDDLANKAYVDAMARGLSTHPPARVIAAVDIDLIFAPASIDGVLLNVGDRVLVAGQNDPTKNGIYIFNGADEAPTRADDGVDPYLKGGDYFFISEGNLYAHTAWILYNSPPITTGTTPLEFQQFSGLGQIVVGAGFTKTGNQIDTGKGNGIRVDSDSISLELAVNAGLALTGTSPNAKLEWASDPARGLGRGASGGHIKLAPLASGLRFTALGEVDLKLDAASALAVDLGGLSVKIADPDQLYFDLGYLRVSGLSKNFNIHNDPVGDNVTAEILTRLTDGGNGDDLHRHSPPPELPGTVEYWTSYGPIVRGSGVYIAGPGIVSTCNVLDPVMARCIGIAGASVADGETVPVIPVGVVSEIMSGAEIGTRFFLNHMGRPVNISLVPRGSRLIQVGIALTHTDLMVQLHDYGTYSGVGMPETGIVTTTGEAIVTSTGEAIQA